MASVADDAASSARCSDGGAAEEGGELGGLFAEAVKGTSKAVESAVDEAYSKGGGEVGTPRRRG